MQNIGLPFLERTLLAAMVLTIAAMVYGTWRDEYFWQTANQRAYDDYQRRDYASAERRASRTRSGRLLPAIGVASSSVPQRSMQRPMALKRLTT